MGDQSQRRFIDPPFPLRIKLSTTKLELLHDLNFHDQRNIKTCLNLLVVISVCGRFWRQRQQIEGFVPDRRSAEREQNNILPAGEYRTHQPYPLINSRPKGSDLINIYKVLNAQNLLYTIVIEQYFTTLTTMQDQPCLKPIWNECHYIKHVCKMEKKETKRWKTYSLLLASSERLRNSCTVTPFCCSQFIFSLSNVDRFSSRSLSCCSRDFRICSWRRWSY